MTKILKTRQVFDISRMETEDAAWDYLQSAEGIHTIKVRDSQQFAAQEHQKPRLVSNTFN